MTVRMSSSPVCTAVYSLRVSMVIDPPQTDAAALAAVWNMCSPTVTSALLQAAKVGAFPVAELE